MIIQKLLTAKSYQLTAKKNGYFTLISVLIVGAVGIAIAVSLLLLGIGSSRSSFILGESGKAKALANACAEVALQKIRESEAFAGSGKLTLNTGECSYEVVKLTGENRTIKAQGKAITVIRKVEVTLDKINPQINISSWRELSDF